MPVLRSGTARRGRIAAVGILLAFLTSLLTLPGTASAADTPARGTATMGMGVIAHDGQGGTPATPAWPRPKVSTSPVTRAT